MEPILLLIKNKKSIFNKSFILYPIILLFGLVLSFYIFIQKDPISILDSRGYELAGVTDDVVTGVSSLKRGTDPWMLETDEFPDLLNFIGADGIVCVNVGWAFYGTDVTGRIVELDFGLNGYLDVSAMVSGMYILSMKDKNDNLVYSSKVMIEN